MGKKHSINFGAKESKRSKHIKAIKLGALKIISTALDAFLTQSEGKDYSDFDNVKPLEVNAV